MRPENSNDELVRRMIEEVWNGERPDRLPAFWADPTRAEAEQLHSVLVGAFPDLRITVEDTVADDDKVATARSSRPGPRSTRSGCSVSSAARIRARLATEPGLPRCPGLLRTPILRDHL